MISTQYILILLSKEGGKIENAPAKELVSFYKVPLKFQNNFVGEMF
jgi:hypothetical protein